MTFSDTRSELFSFSRMSENGFHTCGNDLHFQKSLLFLIAPVVTRHRKYWPPAQTKSVIAEEGIWHFRDAFLFFNR